MEDTKVKKSHKSSGKHKKSKKHKHKKDRCSSSSDSDSNIEMEWVEAPAKSVETKRDSWMTQESEFVPTLTREQMKEGEVSSRERKRRAQELKREEEKDVMRGRELNPHWEKGGTGLPDEAEPVSKPRLPAMSVGDGGYAFLSKARLRIREQADREGRSMEEVAVERWGSLAALDAMIAEAKERMHGHSHHRHRRERAGSAERDIQFKKPNDRRSGKCNVSSTRKEGGGSWRREEDWQRYKERGGDYDRRRGYEEKGGDSDRRSYEESSGDSYKRRSYEERGGDSDRRGYEERGRESGEKRSKDDGDRWRYDKRGGESDRSNSGKSQDESRERSKLPAWKKPKPVTDEDTFKDTSPKSSSEENEGLEKETPIKEYATADTLNQLTAKRMRAELSGDTALAARLLEEEKACRESGGSGIFKKEGAGDYHTSRGGTSAGGRDRVKLTKLDSSGQQRAIVASREDAGFQRRTEKQQKRSNKYFDDSSKYSLRQMFEREKLTTTEDNLEMFMEVSGQCDDSKEENETSGISKKAIQKMGHTVQEERDIQKAINQHQKMSSALEKCEYCLDQPNMKQHLIVTIYEQVYVCVPNFQSLVSGHCLIIPKRHVPSLLHLDEDEWNAFQDALRSVRQLFRAQGKNVVFLETSLLFSRCPHAVGECIPLPMEQGLEAPLYFKKAILESEEEWAHNVKLVDLKTKGLRRSIPKNLPYFCVMFDPSGGYAHVIEDEKAFPRNFGKEVVGGMMDIDYNQLYKNRKEDPIKKSKEAVEFTRMWESFHNADSD